MPDRNPSFQCFVSLIFSSFIICHLSLSIVDLLISVLCTQIERSLLSISTRHAPYCWLATSVFWDSVRHRGQKRFSKIAQCTFKERRAGPLLRLMYITETLINPLFTDVAFRRENEGDGSGHYESGGVMSPPSLVPSARLPGGPLARKNVLIFVSFLSLASSYENMNDHLF